MVRTTVLSLILSAVSVTVALIAFEPTWWGVGLIALSVMGVAWLAMMWLRPERSRPATTALEAEAGGTIKVRDAEFSGYDQVGIARGDGSSIEARDFKADR